MANELPNPLKPLADMAQQLSVGVKSVADNLTRPLGLPALPELPALPMLAGNPGNPGNPGKGNPGNSALALPGLPDLTKAITSVEDVVIPQGLPRPSAVLTGMAAPAKPPAPASPTATRPVPSAAPGPSLLTESAVPGVQTGPGLYFFR